MLRLIQRLDESTEDVVEFHHTVAIDRTSGGTARVRVVGIVVEMAAAGGVVEEKGFVPALHISDKLFTVCRPVLIQIPDRGEVDFIDGFAFVFVGRGAVDVIFAEI